MAEATSSSSSSSSSGSSGSSSPPSTPSKPTQYIRASANDDVLEPDALRGNEKIIADTGIQDDEEDRRQKQKDAEKK